MIKGIKPAYLDPRCFALVTLSPVYPMLSFSMILRSLGGSNSSILATNIPLDWAYATIMWHPGSEKLEHPVFQPRDRGEVLWNMTLLSIEQISSLLQSTLGTRDYIGMSTLCLPLLLYASSRTTQSSGITLAAEHEDGGELHSAGTLAGTLILARKQGIPGKQAMKSGMTRQVSTLNVLASSQQPKQSRQITTWQLQIVKK